MWSKFHIELFLPHQLNVFCLELHTVPVNFNRILFPMCFSFGFNNSEKSWVSHSNEDLFELDLRPLWEACQNIWPILTKYGYMLFVHVVRSIFLSSLSAACLRLCDLESRVVTKSEFCGWAYSRRIYTDKTDDPGLRWSEMAGSRTCNLSGPTSLNRCINIYWLALIA